MVREQGLHLTTAPVLLYVCSFYRFVNGNLIARKAINPNSITVVECGTDNIPSWLFGCSVCLKYKSQCLCSAQLCHKENMQETGFTVGTDSVFRTPPPLYFSLFVK